jgi:hypothetical protein
MEIPKPTGLKRKSGRKNLPLFRFKVFSGLFSLFKFDFKLALKISPFRMPKGRKERSFLSNEQKSGQEGGNRIPF